MNMKEIKQQQQQHQKIPLKVFNSKLYKIYFAQDLSPKQTQITKLALEVCNSFSFNFAFISAQRLSVFDLSFAYTKVAIT